MIPSPKPMYPYIFPVVGGFLGAIIGLVGGLMLPSLIEKKKEPRKITSNNLAGAVLESCINFVFDGVGIFYSAIPGLICGLIGGIISGTFLAKRIGS